MKTLVIGLGIGRLYEKALTKLGHKVFTMDPDQSKQATFTSLSTAVYAHPKLDAVFICTPNSTHDSIAQLMAKHSRIVFVEKPGVMNSQRWKGLKAGYPNVRFMMCKNNMWRSYNEEFRLRTQAADLIKINWINENRVPSPGGWFTNKKLAFGGVSKDLMPHLLSIFIGLNPNTYEDFTVIKNTKTQRWQLQDVINTQYGTVNPEGVYDVDDFAEITLTDGNKTYELTADWRSKQITDIGIHCYQRGERVKSFDLGLCPEAAYEQMIKDVFTQVDNEDFWQKQFNYDVWIHERTA